MVQLAVKWGLMTEEEKAPYNEKAKEVKDAHLNRVWSLCIYDDTNLKTLSRKVSRVTLVTTKQ